LCESRAVVGRERTLTRVDRAIEKLAGLGGVVQRVRLA